MDTSINESYNEIAYALPCRWDARLARLISNILCPPVTGLIAIFMMVNSINEASAWRWAAFSISLSMGVPIGYLTWKVHKREITDFHIAVRSQRYRPIFLSICCGLLNLAILSIWHAPLLLISMLVYGILLAAVLLIITLRWKISGHMAAMTATSLIGIELVGPVLLPTLLLIPLVAWARIRIRRHTLSQTIAGAVLGVIYFYLVFR